MLSILSRCKIKILNKIKDRLQFLDKIEDITSIVFQLFDR